jgi:putative NIF3 family GTP cyclohydrolase 1 type 2
MAAADRDALLTKKVAHHPASCERELQMQRVDATHDCEVFG